MMMSESEASQQPRVNASMPASWYAPASTSKKKKMSPTIVAASPAWCFPKGSLAQIGDERIWTQKRHARTAVARRAQRRKRRIPHGSAVAIMKSWPACNQLHVAGDVRYLLQ